MIIVAAPIFPSQKNISKLFSHTFILALQTTNYSLDASNLRDTSSSKQKKINKIVLMNFVKGKYDYIFNNFLI